MLQPRYTVDKRESALRRLLEDRLQKPAPLLHASLPLPFATHAVIRVRCSGHVFGQEFARRNHGLHEAEVAGALDSLEACEGAMLVATVPCRVVGVVVAPSCGIRHGRAQYAMGSPREYYTQVCLDHK